MSEFQKMLISKVTSVCRSNPTEYVLCVFVYCGSLSPPLVIVIAIYVYIWDVHKLLQTEIHMYIHNYEHLLTTEVYHYTSANLDILSEEWGMFIHDLGHQTHPSFPRRDTPLTPR